MEFVVWKKFKPVLTASVFSLLFLMTPGFANANELDNSSTEGTTGAALHDTSLTAEEQAKWEKLAKEKDQWLEESLKQSSLENTNPVGEFYYLSVINERQTTSYYCGPASAVQSLSFHKSKSGVSTSLPSQSTLASKMGTTKSGSLTTKIASTLNSYKDTFKFSSNPYVAADVTNLSSPLSTFETRVKGVLRNQTNAPILLVETQYLPYYNGYGTRHYITVSGYAYTYDSGVKQIRVVDPNNTDAYRGTFWQPIGSTKVNGVFRAVYEADARGTNMAMAY